MNTTQPKLLNNWAIIPLSKKQLLISILLFSMGIGLIQCTPYIEEKYNYNIKTTGADGYRCLMAWGGSLSAFGWVAMPELIDTYHAEKTDIRRWSSAFPADGWDRVKVFEEYTKNLYPFIQQEMADNRISSAYWESLNQQYNWKLEFSDKDFSLYDYRIRLLNQEYHKYLVDPSWPVTAGDKYAPAELTLYLQHRLDPIKYKVVLKLRNKEIEYDDVEDTLNHMNKSRALLKFFDKFYAKAGDEVVSIYLDFDFSMEKMKLKLKAGDYEEEFPDYTYKIYDSERYNYR